MGLATLARRHIARLSTVAGPCSTLDSENANCAIKIPYYTALKLMSAIILARLMNSVKNALKTHVECVVTKYWLDSKTALCWIQTGESGNSLCAID